MSATRQTGNRKFRSANIHEIARLSRVSTASVSRALNGEPGVSEETAKRIQEIAGKLGYYPSSSARALVTGRSRTFGLLVSDIVNPFFAELLREFEEEAVRQQYEVIVANINNDPRRIQQSARRLLERKVDGVAFMTAEQSPLSRELRKRQIPVVLLDSGASSAYVSILKIRALPGMQEALKHLEALGHKKIGYIGAPASLAPGKLRLQAFLQAVEGSSLVAPSAFISTENEPTIRGGQHGMLKMLQIRERPTAVIVFNDAMALGALHAARVQNIKVPRELSLIGFDNIELGEFVDPGLTTIKCSRSELAHFAFNTLLAMSYGAVGESISLQTSLLIRSSTDVANRSK
jgi:DNA-binding LacI/PurR family transcriptional regulator